MNDIKNKRFRRWMAVCSWAGFIYATLYIARPVCDFFKQYSWFSFSVNMSLALFLVITLWVLLKKGYIRKASTWALLCFVIVGYGLGIMLIPIPEERLHFIEYGVLAFLVYWALILDIKNNGAYFGAFAITSLLGAVDEGIQYLLPNRYYQFQDICLNSASAALGLIFVFIFLRDQER